MPAASFSSVAEMLLHRLQATPDAEAFYYPDADENWLTQTWRDVGVSVKAIAGGLRELGIEIEDRCAILSNTRYEWILADLGIVCAGGAATTIYPSSTGEECAYIINDSNSKVVFAEDQEQVDKLIEVREQIPGVEKIICMGSIRSDADGLVVTMRDLQSAGDTWHSENQGGYEERIKALKPTHLATLIYTSGTTGKPKGVELLHDCWIFEAEAMDNMGFLSPADKQYLWLPLSHSFGKVLEMSIIRIGIPTAIDGRIDKIVENLAHVQPTFIAAVPRIFEKIYNKAVSGAREKSKTVYRIFKWSMEVGQEVSALRQRGIEPQGMLRLRYAIADRLVFKKLRAKFGGRVKFFISGSAPLSPDIAIFFHASNLLILEGYGLTESSAASFVNLPGKYRFGSVGMPLPGVEFKLSEDDNEVLIKSRGVMRGYYNLSEVTAETLQEGWLRTGDIGKVDADGFLRIVDRKKDLIKTSGGKYVAPQKLENKLKSLCPYVSQVLVHGNRRNFCSMLVTLDEEQIMKWAEEAGLEGASYIDLTKHDAVGRILQNYVDALNEPLPSYETIKRFGILPADFTIETGELTPSMKVKRKVVEKKYEDILDGFYTSAMEQL
jgi:long-chain acyl-CoA synthetase